MDAKTIKRAYRARRLVPKRKETTKTKGGGGTATLPAAVPARGLREEKKSKALTFKAEKTKKKALTRQFLQHLQNKPLDLTGSERKELRELFKAQKFIEGWKLTNNNRAPAFGSSKMRYTVGHMTRVGPCGRYKNQLKFCANGLHFCTTPFGLRKYKSLYDKPRLFRVLAHGRVRIGRKKSIATCLTVVQEYHGKAKHIFLGGSRKLN